MNIWCSHRSRLTSFRNQTIALNNCDRIRIAPTVKTDGGSPLVLLIRKIIKTNNKEAIKESSWQTRRHGISRDVCQISITNENSVILIILMTQPKYN